MAFAVSRSSKRNRGQYEDHNVSQGESPTLSSLKIDTAPDHWNVRYSNLGGTGDFNSENYWSGPTEIAFRNKIALEHYTDGLTAKIAIERDAVNTNPWNYCRSQMKFSTCYDQSGSGGYPSLRPCMLLDTYGQLHTIGGVFSLAALPSSDDRLKHNEKNVTGALDTIMKLKGKEYIKTQKLYDANHNFTLDADGEPVITDEEGNEKKLPVGEYVWEKGFIAQEVEADVPELVRSVVNTHNLEGQEVKHLNYSNIFATNVCATQELCELVRVQTIAIEELTKRVQELEAVIAPPDLTRQ